MAWNIDTAATVTAAGLWLMLLTNAVAHGQTFTRCDEINNLYYCYHTDGSLANWSDARQLCLNRGSTLPIIKDVSIQSVFEQFLDNSNSTSPAWIAAHTVPVNSSSKWHWIDGQSTNLTPTLSNNDHLYPKWCSAIRNDTVRSNHLLLEESPWVNSPPYFICQYNDVINCVSASGFLYNSKCYKYYSELVQGPWPSRWFTAVNRCLAKSGSLAVFDDNFLTNLSLPWLSSTNDGYYQARIGLIKSWWTWSDTVGPVDVLYNKFNSSEGVADIGPPYNPPQSPGSTDYCAVAGRTGYWRVENCATEQRLVVCQSVSAVTTTTTTTSTTSPSTQTSLGTVHPNTGSSTAGQKSADDRKSSSSNAAVTVIGVLLGLTIVVVIVLVVQSQRKFRQLQQQLMQFTRASPSAASDAAVTSLHLRHQSNGDVTGGSAYAHLEQSTMTHQSAYDTLQSPAAATARRH